MCPMLRTPRKSNVKKGTGVQQKREKDKGFHIPVKEVLETYTSKRFIKQLDEKKAHSQAIIPKITFQELGNIV